LSLAEGELVMARSELDELHDQLYVLSCAVSDVQHDLAEPMTLDEALGALRWLLEAAAPLAARRVTPSASERR
jgi:hypothetical protein